VKAQEQSQRANPQICAVGIPILNRHFLLNSTRLPGRVHVPSVDPKTDGARTRAQSAQVRKRISAVAVW
jgi:hypothetical protein